MFKLIAILWTVVAVICMGNVLYDAETDLHGSVSVYMDPVR